MDVLIVGAGLAGITAAREMVSPEFTKLQIKILEKARGFGGRMATRWDTDHPARWDHGAQFLTIGDPRFKAELLPFLENGSLKKWNTSGVTILPESQSRDRYSFTEGMSGVVRSLGQKLRDEGKVHFQSRVQTISEMALGRGWKVICEDGVSYETKSLLLTAPLPQSLELLLTSKIPCRDLDILSKIVYRSCLAVVAEFPGGYALPEPRYVENPSPEIRGIFDQNFKGISAGKSVLVIHGSPTISKTLYDAPEDLVIETLLCASRPFLGLPPLPEPVKVSLHRWRYSDPETTYPQLFYSEVEREGSSPLIIAGDAFGGPRVEGAFLSGLAAAEKLKSLLQ